jgi:hypothetical protein
MADNMRKRFGHFFAAAICGMLVSCSAVDEDLSAANGVDVNASANGAEILSLFSENPQGKLTRDPFQLPLVRQEKKWVTASGTTLPTLSGIAFAGGKAQAFFLAKGERVTATNGDTVGGYVIVTIGADRVQLKERKTGKQLFILLSNN